MREMRRGGWQWNKIVYTETQTTKNSCEAPQNETWLKGRGLSGEHIQLCAEGARRMPNLSGKRTEKQIDYLLRRLQSLFRAAFLFYVGCMKR